MLTLIPVRDSESPTGNNYIRFSCPFCIAGDLRHHSDIAIEDPAQDW
jgi:hypothetical protein